MTVDMSVPEYQFLESVAQKTLLGIRFWDPVLDAQIQDGLQVTLFPVDNTDKVSQAFKTRSGIYAFNNIPGLSEQETDTTEVNVGSPPETKSYVLNVEDTSRQFSSAALLIELPLPYSGIFLVDDNITSPSTVPRGFNLYSSIERSVTSQFVFVRGELINRITQEPAAHALVRVQTEDAFSWFAISDSEGRFSVMLPYPFLNISYGSSPPVSDGMRLFERSWNIELSIMYEPAAHEEISGAELPDYSSILSQSQALLYTESPESNLGEVSSLQVELVYGRDLIIKTAGFSKLYVSPTGSPV